MESRKSSRRSSSRRNETADERLDRLLERERAASRRQVSEPVRGQGQLAVRSVRVEAAEGTEAEERGRPSEVMGQLALTGLSPEQQNLIRQMADSMRMSGQPARPDFLPPPLAVGERARSQSSQDYGARGACGAGGHGDLLGPLSLPVSYGPGGYGGQLGFPYANGSGRDERVPGQEVVQSGTPNPVVMNLFPEEGHRDGRALRQGDEVAGVPPLAISPVPTVLAMNSAVNPFWSESVRRGAAGEECPEAGSHAMQFGDQEHGGRLSQRDMEELEEIRKKGVQDLEQRLKEELQRRGGGSTESFKSMANQVSARGGRGVEFTPLITPPGLHGEGGVQQSGGSGESLTESLRSMELPKLDESTTAVGFGDWLTVIQPMMADISSTSSRWWAMTLDGAVQAYQQWAVSSPLEKLRMKIVQGEESKKYPRTEQRAVTMILAAMPEEPRREAIAARKLSVSELLFRLFITYQPGGQKERAALLMELADEKTNNFNGALELLRAIKAWRRNIVRTQELGVQLPDPLVLANVLAKWADSLGKLGGGQAAYRIATLREMLDLDGRPTHGQVAEFAEVLQAEAEQLVLMKNTTVLAQNSQENGKKKEMIKAAALSGGGHSGGQQQQQRTNQGGGQGDGPPKAKCKFWGTTVGCKRGESCLYLHSWDGIQKKGRCWNCSAEGHMKPECPYLKTESGQTADKTKVARMAGKGAAKGGASKPTNNGSGAKPEEGSSTSSTSSTASSTTQGVSGDKPKKEIVEEGGASALMGEVASLMKSLRSIKAVQVKFLEGRVDGEAEEKVALLDGGATHALRQGSEKELLEAEPIEVELAYGKAVLFKKCGSNTLLSREPVEPIIPLRLLVDQGYVIDWSSNSCRIKHPERGEVQCWRRQGCPVLSEEEGLKLLKELEAGYMKEVDEETVRWWSQRYPEVPKEVWTFMKGQGEDWKTLPGELPWNRHQRRRIEKAKGVILHIFSGARESMRRWGDLCAGGFEVLTLDILRSKSEDLRNAKTWAYLWELASRGKLTMIFGGPPCRSTSRLRHQQPGPKPLRGRGDLRFQLPELGASEKWMVTGDTALILKMMGLYQRTKEVVPKEHKVGFLMEHPADPESYLPEGQARQMPSIWEWEEVVSFALDFGMSWVHFDQGAMGHSRRKPTTVLTDLKAMEQLNGMRDERRVTQKIEEDLDMRLKQTASWAEWAPGFVAAIKVAIQDFLENSVQLKKALTLEQWKQHVKQNHVPYRRDCRVCVECMGQDAPHRRQQQSGSMAYNLSMDIAGPFRIGWDFGYGQEARYGLLATVPVPLGTEVDEEPPKKEEGVSEEPGEAEVQYSEDPEPLKDVDDIEDDLGLEDEMEEILADADDGQELPPEKRGPEEKEVTMEEATRPIKVQNVTLFEPLASRQTSELVKGMERIWSQLRALGIPCYRCHSDHAKEFVSKPMRQWIAQKGMVQTTTGGDNPASSGRIESELCQWKRRLRLTMASAKVPVEEWPNVARHVMEERNRAQLQRLWPESGSDAGV